MVIANGGYCENDRWGAMEGKKGEFKTREIDAVKFSFVNESNDSFRVY